MKDEKLKEVLDKHKQFLIGDKRGVKADLSYADLRGADLSYADLRGANLEGVDLKEAEMFTGWTLMPHQRLQRRSGKYYCDD